MPSRFEMPQNPEIPDPDAKIDITKRYDVYCMWFGQQAVVYRNVLFKGAKVLFGHGKFDIASQFLELEQADGQNVFVNRHSVTAFCEHGKNPGAEIIKEQ